MLETETAFITTLREMAEEIEIFVKNITRTLVEKGAYDMRQLGSPEPSWLEKEFNYITYDEAVNILENHGDRLTFPLKYGDPLSKEHELFLVDHSNGPVFVVNWPKDGKPFYMRECDDDASKVMTIKQK